MRKPIRPLEFSADRQYGSKPQLATSFWQTYCSVSAPLNSVNTALPTRTTVGARSKQLAASTQDEEALPVSALLVYDGGQRHLTTFFSDCGIEVASNDIFPT